MKDITTQETLDIQALKQKPVTLEVPVVRGKTRITEVSIRKLTTGDLRGARLQPLLETDVDALIRVLPRVTVPTLTPEEILNLDPADLYQLEAILTLFFVPNSALSASPTD
ncbi:phage tail assembly protein [Candidatus Symbiopectobacterium sp.]|uniref:phage tail assembly protein n=1 Tax=Candidatus Symbiopectobacterium sp. TaxID=2816440 RepID=UPI0025BC3392|nr:phage tail assembly protein [Candidatus Symbiopectobacterium sp.]